MADAALMQDTQAGLDAIWRTAGRRLTFGSIMMDIFALTWTITAAAFVYNEIRLNIYQPAMMDPLANWTPYWRVFGFPNLLVFLPVVMYWLVFYRLAPLLVIYYVVAASAIGLNIYSLIMLGIDWGNNCSTTLWCACIKNWIWDPVSNSWTTTSFCSDEDGDTGEPSPVFVVHFFLLCAMSLMALLSVFIAAWIHYTYSVRNKALDNNNMFRDLDTAGYSSLSINSQVSEERTLTPPENGRVKRN